MKLFKVLYLIGNTVERVEVTKEKLAEKVKEIIDSDSEILEIAPIYEPS